MINIEENTNRVINIVKAKFGFNDKSQSTNDKTFVLNFGFCYLNLF